MTFHSIIEKTATSFEYYEKNRRTVYYGKENLS